MGAGTGNQQAGDGRAEIPLQSEGNLLWNQEEAVLQTKSRSHLLEDSLSFSLRGGQSFLLVMPSVDQRRPTLMRERRLLYSKSTNVHVRRI